MIRGYYMGALKIKKYVIGWYQLLFRGLDADIVGNEAINYGTGIDANADILNSNVFTGDGLGTGLFIPNASVKGGQIIDVEFEFEHTDLLTDQAYFWCGGDNATYKGCNLRFQANGYLNFSTANGSQVLYANNGGVGQGNIQQYYISGKNKISIYWDGQTGGLVTVTLNDTVVTSSTNTVAWSGNSTTTIVRFLWGLDAKYFNGHMYKIVSRIPQLPFNVSAQMGAGKVITDDSGYNNMLINNNLGFDVWQNKSDLADAIPLSQGFAKLNNSLLPNYALKMQNSDIDINIIKLYWNGATEYTVNAQGTGDYTTIREAIIAQSTTFSERVIINVEAGTYYEQDIIGSDWVWLRGIGEVNIISDGLSTAISPVDYSNPTYANTAYNLIPRAYKHVFWLHESMLITDITTTCNDVKYNVHSDLGGYYQYYFYNCIFNYRSEDSAFLFNVGIGTFNGQQQNYIDCDLNIISNLDVSNSSRINFHNSTGAGSVNGGSLILQGVTVNFGDIVTVYQLETTTENYEYIDIRKCDVPSGMGISIESTSTAFAYTINVIYDDDSLIITSINRPDYQSYIGKYIKGGFADTGNTLLQPDDQTIFNITKQHPALDIFYGATSADRLPVTYAQLIAIDTTGIPDSDFSITITDGVITNISFSKQ